MINFDSCYKNAKKIALEALKPGATFAIALDPKKKSYLLLNPKTIENGDTYGCCFAVDLSTGDISEMASSLCVVPLEIDAEIHLSSYNFA